MCAINPKHKKLFTLAAYTSHNMTTKAFEKLVCEKALELEKELNKNGCLRWHIFGVTEDA